LVWSQHGSYVGLDHCPFMYGCVQLLFMAVSYVVDCALFWLVLKCFECEQKTREEELAEQEKVEEKDDCKFSFPVAW
jgi:hypothetical protein